MKDMQADGETIVGKVLGIALRCPDKAQMTPVSQARAIENGGLEGDLAVSPERGVTFISQAQWRTVISELGANLPWWTRRANVLVDAPSLAHLIGRRIRVGEMEVQIIAETRPCGLMDKLHMGLKDTLKPYCRAGVYGRVIKSGLFEIGNQVVMID
jgi:MOSC domain-containing protein YiiM